MVCDYKLRVSGVGGTIAMHSLIGDGIGCGACLATPVSTPWEATGHAWAHARLDRWVHLERTPHAMARTTTANTTTLVVVASRTVRLSFSWAVAVGGVAWVRVRVRVRVRVSYRGPGLVVVWPGTEASEHTSVAGE